MTRWEFTIVHCLYIAGGNASATCLKMLVMRFADVEWPAPMSLLRHFAAHYTFLVIIIINSLLPTALIIILKRVITLRLSDYC